MQRGLPVVVVKSARHLVHPLSLHSLSQSTCYDGWWTRHRVQHQGRVGSTYPRSEGQQQSGTRAGTPRAAASALEDLDSLRMLPVQHRQPSAQICYALQYYCYSGSLHRARIQALAYVGPLYAELIVSTLCASQVVIDFSATW